MDAGWQGNVFLRTRVEPHDDLSIVHVRGELDLLTAKTFEEQLAGLLTRGAVIVNLADVEMLDLAGVDALRLVDRQARQRGSQLAIVGSQPIVHKVINAMRLSSSLTVCESVAEAVASVRRRKGSE